MWFNSPSLSPWPLSRCCTVDYHQDWQGKCAHDNLHGKVSSSLPMHVKVVHLPHPATWLASGPRSSVPHLMTAHWSMPMTWWTKAARGLPSPPSHIKVQWGHTAPQTSWYSMMLAYSESGGVTRKTWKPRNTVFYTDMSSENYSWIFLWPKNVSPE